MYDKLPQDLQDFEALLTRTLRHATQTLAGIDRRARLSRAGARARSPRGYTPPVTSGSTVRSGCVPSTIVRPTCMPSSRAACSVAKLASPSA